MISNNVSSDYMISPKTVNEISWGIAVIPYWYTFPQHNSTPTICIVQKTAYVDALHENIIYPILKVTRGPSQYKDGDLPV